MMKVKPFSYIIPPRRKSHDSTTAHIHATKWMSTSSCSEFRKKRSSSDSKGKKGKINSRNYHPVFSQSTNLCAFGGIGAVVVFVLLGFIGVAGQGKLSEMHSSNDATFPARRDFIPVKQSLVYKNINSLSNLGMVDENANYDDDVALQRRISSMGHYGAKYGNASLFSYNYSSQPPPQLNPYYSEQYKLEPTFSIVHGSTPHENLLLSLHEDGQYVHRLPSKNISEEIDENVINFQPLAKLQSNQEDGYSNNKEEERTIFHGGGSLPRRNPYPTVLEPLTPNSTGRISSMNNGFRSSKYHNYPLKHSLGNSLKSPRLHTEEEEEEDIDERELEEIPNTHKSKSGHIMTKPAFRPSPAGDHYTTADLDDYDDEEALERFMPGNVSHTSGKLRFRQISQAEVDGIESENESSMRSRKRPRRSVVHLYDMVVCSTGCNPLIFKGYGCYCGFLGSGLTVDGIDKCCAKHDWCYHHAKCPPLLTYFVPYYWRCDHGRPQCVTDFRGWKGVCGAHLCECDRQFAECLKKFPCPRSRAMCVTSPWSNNEPADPRAFPFAISKRVRPWPPPPLLPPPLAPLPPPGIPLLPYPALGRFFPRFN